jgi:hypothetical protein
VIPGASRARRDTRVLRAMAAVLCIAVGLAMLVRVLA